MGGLMYKALQLFRNSLIQITKSFSRLFHFKLSNFLTLKPSLSNFKLSNFSTLKPSFPNFQLLTFKLSTITFLIFITLLIPQWSSAQQLASLLPNISPSSDHPTYDNWPLKTSKTDNRHLIPVNYHLAQYGDIEGGLGEAAFFRLEEQIVTSASKYAQRIIESPSAIAVITKDDIEKSGAREITDLFGFVPGVMAVKTSSIMQDVMIRGYPQIFSPRILVLWDGIPLYNPHFSGLFWSYLPFSLPSIERIEIIRGASSTLYGANAFSGVINIISKDVDDESSVHAYASGGNLQYTKEEVIWNQPINDDIRFRLSALFRHDRGFGAGNGAGQLDGMTVGQANLDFAFDLASGTQMQVYSYFRGGDIDETFTGAFRQVDEDLRNLITGFRLKHEFNDNQNLSFQATYQDQVAQFITLGIDSSLRRREVNTDLQYTHRFGDKDILVTGANFREGGYAAHFITKPALENLTLASFFVNNDFRILENLIFTAGGRYEYDTFSQSQLSGRANLTFLPVENQALRASFSRAVRTPSVSDERANITVPGNAPFPPGTVFNFNGNPAINPESVLAAEFGWLGHFWDGRIQTGLQFYFNDIEDFISQGIQSIDLSATPPEVNFSLINIGDGRVYGVETEMTTQLTEWWRIALNYTFTKQTALDRGVFPKHLVSYKNRFVFDDIGLSAELLFNWISPYKVFDLTTGITSSVGHIFRLDARLAKKLFNDHVELSIAGQNLVDTPHTEGDPLNRVDRSYYGMVSLNY